MRENLSQQTAQRLYARIVAEKRLRPGDKLPNEVELSAQLGVSRLSFASENHMQELLDVLPGSVSVMGLMNDPDNQVRLVIDREVLEEEYVGCHPCKNTSSIKLHTSDLLEKFLPAVHHTPTVVTL